MPTVSLMIELNWGLEFNHSTHYLVTMERTSYAGMRCSLARTLELIGDWWSPLIIRDLFLGIARFDELAEDLGISRNLLTTRLKSLVANGIVERTAYQLHPPRYEYRLTEAGRDLRPAILALTEWGDRWAAPEEGRPMLFVHKTCGHQFRPQLTCSECGEVIGADDVMAVPGPGGAAKPGTMLVGKRLGVPPPQAASRS